MGEALPWSVSEGGERLVTVMVEAPSWVLLRRRAVLRAVSFSKVTLADLVSPEGVTWMSEIFPLPRR